MHTAKIERVGPFIINRIQMDPGCGHFGWHEHVDPHDTIMLRGRAKVSVRDGRAAIQSREVGPGDIIAMKAGEEHQVVPIEYPIEFLCMFPEDAKGPDVRVQRYHGTSEGDFTGQTLSIGWLSLANIWPSILLWPVYWRYRRAQKG